MASAGLPFAKRCSGSSREGVLDVETGRGFRLRPLAREELRDVGGILAALEPLALRLVPDFAPEKLAALTELARQLEQTRGDISRIVELDDAWHRKLLEDCPNRLLLDLITTLRQVPRRYLHAYLREAGRLSLSTLHHGRILEALRRGDRSAAGRAARAPLAARHRGDGGLDQVTRPITTAQVVAWRCDTPGCEERAHLNNAGAALVPRPVIEAISRHLELEQDAGRLRGRRGSPRGAWMRRPGRVARLLGAPPGTIAMSQNSTTAFAQALEAFDFRPGDRILTSRADYASNQIMYLSLARRRGVEVVRAPDLPGGGIDPDGDPRPDSLGVAPPSSSLTWIPTNSGLVQDVEAVGRICGEADVPYLVDACQAVGQMPVDVERLHCDYLAAAARKFLRGPRGVGFLYVSDRALSAGAHPLLVDMHGATWSDADSFTLTPDATTVRELGDRLRPGPRTRRRGGVRAGGRDRDRARPRSRTGPVRPRTARGARRACGCSIVVRSSAPS